MPRAGIAITSTLGKAMGMTARDTATMLMANVIATPIAMVIARVTAMEKAMLMANVIAIAIVKARVTAMEKAMLMANVIAIAIVKARVTAMEKAMLIVMVVILVMVHTPDTGIIAMTMTTVVAVDIPMALIAVTLNVKTVKGMIMVDTDILMGTVMDQHMGMDPLIEHQVFLRKLMTWSTATPVTLANFQEYIIQS